MKLQRKLEPGEYFYRFFRKRTSSFHASIYKAGITADTHDIHKARVDLKKVFALFNFFEMLGALGFNQKKNASLFRDIFLQAGKIRENQVNLQNIEKYRPDTSGMILFSRFLKKEQKKFTKAFIAAVVQFDEKRLKEVTKTIKKCCNDINSETISRKSGDYLSKKAGKLKLLAEHPEEEKNIHKIRQELKKTGAIISLLYQIRPEQDIERLIAKVNETEVLIGEWHDQIVLLDSLDRFFKSETKIETGLLKEMTDLKEQIESENIRRLDTIMPLVLDVTLMILQKPPEDKENKNLNGNTVN
jgi:CHAD domain-containing protein